MTHDERRVLSVLVSLILDRAAWSVIRRTSSSETHTHNHAHITSHHGEEVGGGSTCRVSVGTGSHLTGSRGRTPVQVWG